MVRQRNVHWLTAMSNDIAVDPEAVLQKLSEKSRRLDFHL